jgi:hypothetical protein
MKRNHSFFIICLLAALAGAGCQKLDRPGMPDYPEDQANPGGALNFFTAFEGTEVDSIRANFGQPVNATWEDGISGKAYKGSPDSYIKYPSANNFSRATSFTISFWLKKTPHAPGSSAQMVFGLSTTNEIDHRSDIFLLIEDGNQSSAALGAFKFYLLDQWFEYTGDKRIPNVLNDQWHHFAFTYDEVSSKLVTYVDGAVLTNLPAGFGDVKFQGNPRGKLDLTKSAGLVIGGPAALAVGEKPPVWMVEYDGSLDQFRLYNKALTQAEITALFNGKQ